MELVVDFLETSIFQARKFSRVQFLEVAWKYKDLLVVA